MQQRPSSRLLVVNRESELLLFRFEHKAGPLAGQTFWATPGGGLEPGESYEEAATRELHEEVGIETRDPGAQIARHLVRFTLPSGEEVEADERYFLIQVETHIVSSARWTEFEHEVMTDHRWWSQQDLRATAEQVWPENLEAILTDAGIWRAAR